MRPIRSAWLLVAVLTAYGAQAATSFTVTYSPKVFAGPFTGKVVVYVSTGSEEPRFGPDWFRPEPVVIASFRGVTPGQAMVLNDADTESKPGQLERLPAGEYTLQAVVDRNLGGRAVGTSPGNLYSAPRTVRIDPQKEVSIELNCDQVVPEPAFKDTVSVKGVRFQSKLLTKFYGRPTYIHAAVGLPEGWSEHPARRYPVVYELPGFGGNHWGWSGSEHMAGTEKDGEPFIVVSLDPDCPTGYSAFADSAVNGPWGSALTQEFIPYLEKAFRGVGKPWARFVTGHSSGGWASLWLQVAYPDFFGGTWSLSPDPVDFRAFQGVDLYAPNQNLYFDGKGSLRPSARFDSTVVLTIRAFCEREWGLRGEQMGSFEGVFSPRGLDGEPAKLWNRATGGVDPKVAAAWRRYDIGLLLRTNWPKLAPKLKGKLFVLCGTEDTFYLDSAVRLLQKDLKALKSDAVVELVPGDHGSVLTYELRRRIAKQMAAKYRASAKAAGAS